MKKIINTSTISVFMIYIVLSSCSSTNLMTISVTEPSPVYIPATLKKIGIIDRSLPSKENESLDKLEKILSAEGKNMDKDAARQAVTGLRDELLNSRRFTEMKIIDSINVRSPGSGIFPAALSWETVGRICRENHVDAIFALSYYDTDARIDYKAVPVTVAGPLGINIPTLEHHASVSTLIKCGWRIYDPKDRLILDEFPINEHVTTAGAGINPVKAVESITGRKEAVLQMSNDIGHNYALRILPFRTRVARDYYVRGTENFKIAKRRAQTGDWDGAAELWNKEVTNPKRKVAGRACYNMGIISEINDDLDAAVEWTSKSYTDYKNKTALRYLNVLKYRIERNIQLQEQLKTVNSNQ